MNTIRTRFAPSPTGYLHIGGARTCLFNWLFARATQGVFVLRIEDTDQTRSKKEYLEEIFDSLKWLGLDWDEVYYQSKRFSLCTTLANKLLDEDKAYRAEDGSGAIIFRMPQKMVIIKDLIHDEIQFDTATIKDQVLIKSDGTPTYNFACVVDDADLSISHVIRGDDHISNTPKQIVLYEALGFQLPLFAHIPMILSAQGGRLSKRTGATALSQYRVMGFLPEAILNYLSLLGWSAGDDQEIFSKEELVKKFSLEHVNHTAAMFDVDKLRWMNGSYIRGTSVDTLLDMVLPSLREKGYVSENNFDRNWLRDLVQLFQERMNTLTDFVERASCFFVDEVNLNEQARDKLLACDCMQGLMLLRDRFSALDPFDHVTIEQAFRNTIAELAIKSKILIHPLRAAVTGALAGPGIFEVTALLGKEKACRRLTNAIAMIQDQEKEKENA